MLEIADILRRALVPFLLAGGLLLGGVMALLVIQRIVRELRARRRHTLSDRYRPLVERIVLPGPSPAVIEEFRQTPAGHRHVVGDLLLAPLQATRGPVVAHAREAARAMGLVDRWRADLQHAHWWRRADGIRALGLVEAHDALGAIMRAFDDEHEEVRAAALEATGRIADASAIPALIDQLGKGSRFQRARVVDAFRSLGPAVTPALVDLARGSPELMRLAADLLGLIGTVAAIDPLLEWCGDERTDVRVAALGALGSIGLDDRSYYFALRALGDADPQARAMAARALGRGQCVKAVDYLVARLDDDWLPAAQAAGALRRLGGAGRLALESRAGDEGQAGDLCRQMLWSHQPRAAAVPSC